ncbi:hypothetical protein [Aporhodopirellula aestuarii]|uniref:Transmembrane protein n=1 Tax=Aporhodopirellula aestuarii TaxID=2950107 RepID=A0ABT0U8K9_9BACT|nr:hypothetical protein [Aporhodopirellula aestuarii]MCM2372865.1 hypothetical protein [Aporhodopirellula aestuarii]
MNNDADTTDDPSDTNPDSPHLSLRTDGKVVQGPEKRLLDHVRTWVDVFPWLRLVRVCRVAGGPVWVTHVLLVFLLWVAGLSWLGSDDGILSDEVSIGSLISTSVRTAVLPSDVIVGVPPRSYFPGPVFQVDLGGDCPPLSFDWKTVAWTIVIWLPTAMALLRVGAVLTAGRDMPSYLSTFRDVFRRIPAALLIVILPTLVASFFWLVSEGLTWMAALVSGSSEVSHWAGWVTLPVVLPATVIAAVLILGGKFATPLGLAALMIEPDADPIDSLSRGYEYTLRRLPQLVLLIAVATVIASVVVAGWACVLFVGDGLTGAFGPSNLPLLQCLSVLPAVIAVIFLWSMIGGIYLLLRQSAGGQEVEDLSIESGHWKSPKLPSVQSE